MYFIFPGDKSCRSAGLGKDYLGTVHVTRTGRKCQRWVAQSPHEHDNDKPSLFPDNSLADASNYCRNPDDEPEGPWCYTEEPGTRWEHCNIAICQ